MTVAGTVAITRDDLWSVAYWAFHWVVDYLIDHVGDADIVSRLREIEDNNLGWVGLDDFSVEQRQKILPILQHEIVPDAERRLVPQDPDRERAISVIRELADMARSRTT
jgi:hypothetical protein